VCVSIWRREIVEELRFVISIGAFDLPPGSMQLLLCELSHLITGALFPVGTTFQKFVNTSNCQISIKNQPFTQRNGYLTFENKGLFSVKKEIIYYFIFQ
jgi:hypothetical protein